MYEYYSIDLYFRFGNNSYALSPENQIIFYHPGTVLKETILVVDASSMASGRYFSITSNLEFNLGIGSIQVITKENFT